MNNNLITVTELQELEYIIRTKVAKGLPDYNLTTLTTKLINSYKYYKELSDELELKLDEVWEDYYGN